MAYDQQSAYEPPRRAYLNREQQPPNPGRNEYVGYAQPPYDQYDQYDQHAQYSQEHGQTYGQPPPHRNQNYDNAYDESVRNGRQRAYYDEYNGGYDQPPQQRSMPPSYSNEQRDHDLRNQSRTQKALPPQHNAASRSRPGPGPGPREDPRRKPPQGRSPHQSGPRGPPVSNGQQRPPPSQGSRDPYRQRNENAPEAMRPSTAPSQRANRVQNGRPSTAHDQQAYASGGDSYDEGFNSHSLPSGRPITDRQFSSDRARYRPNDVSVNHSESYGQQTFQDQALREITTPIREEYPEQWPMVAGQTPPKAHSEHPYPPQANTYDQQRSASFAQEPQYPQGDASQNLSSYTRGNPPERVRPTVQPIDTEQSRPQQRRAYMDRQPPSPANIPPRPSTSHGSRPTNSARQSPYTQMPHSATVQDQYAGLSKQPNKPWVEDQQQTRHVSLGDIYGDYTTVKSRAPPQAPLNRDEEIEAEMPDFDSAAPQQTSGHRRKQTVDHHLREAPPSSGPLPPLRRMQTAPPQSAYLPHQPPSAQDPEYSQQQYDVQSGLGPFRGPPRKVMPDPYGGSSTPANTINGGYGVPYRNSPGPDAMAQQEVPFQPPQDPVAHEQRNQWSMNDPRDLPYRQGPPPPQRTYTNGPSPSGQHPPQLGQAAWSDPVQNRIGSAPPPQGRMQSREAMTRSAPPPQPRSVPGQQTQNKNPDALPHHPTPVRPGHIPPSQGQNDKPPPVRTYSAQPPSQNAPHQRQDSVDQIAEPVTHNELRRLRGVVDSGQTGPKQHLVLVKQLVEAASVLAGTADSGGRADAKTTAKNRERYLSEALKRLKRLVAGGYPPAQFYMADCYSSGMLGLEMDPKEAFKLYQAAAKGGHPQAAFRTAVCCEIGPEDGGGTNKDFAKAVQWYRRAAALGDSAAMYKLGAVLLKGLLGQQRNIGEAVTWLKRGAERADEDNPHALHELATLYESSNTSPEVRNKVLADDAYARDLYLQAAKLGYRFSQFKLGQAYEYGNLGFPISNRDSIAWYTKAAAQGEHQAELALSGWYLTGAEGILEHSDTEAYLWARKAASSEGGPQVGKAMFAMGYFTENGIGCPTSLVEAKKWYGRAAAYKFPKALERLEEIKRGGGAKNPGGRVAPASGKLTRKDQKKDEENCVVM